MYFLASLMFVFSNAIPTSAAADTLEESAQLSDIDNVSSELLAKEIEFLKLNTRLKLYLLPHNPWSARRSAGIGFTNGTLTAAGALMNGVGRLHYLYAPALAPTPLFEDAGIVRFLANGLSAGAAIFESCSDACADIKERGHGVSLSMMHDRALVLQHDIDELSSTRRSLILSRNFPTEKKAILDQEGNVLTDLRNAETNEFASCFAQAKGNRTSRNLGYTISIASNIGSGAGTLVGIEANHLHGLSKVRRNHMGGVGGICDIVSGSLNVLAPIATRGGAAIERHFCGSKICQELDTQQSSTLKSLLAHQKANETALDGSPLLDLQGVILRTASLHAVSTILESRNSMRISEQSAARNRFFENLAVAAIAGGSKITNGIGGTVGAFEFPRDSYHRFEVQGGTAIAYGAGNTLAAIETARVRLTDEFTTGKAKRSRTGKEDLLNRQLKELESLPAVPQLAGSPTKQTM